MATTLISGVAFGAALVAAGVHDPAVIIAQFKFINFDMIQSFLAATATTSLIAAACDRLGYIHLKPRTPSSLGLLSAYDGNIIGGSLLGAGMALSAACPGVTFAQAGLGLRSGALGLAGGAIGGTIYSGILAPIIARRRQSLAKASSSSSSSSSSPAQQSSTIYAQANISRGAALVGIEVMYAAIIAAALHFGPASPFHPLVAPAVGGLLIGSAQLLSLVLRGSLVGISSVFEDAGKVVASGGKAPASYSSFLFAAGVTAGAYALGLAYPSVTPVADPRVSDLYSVLGGVLFALGARIAGGCTSGHGISGISLLSTSSFITIASTFAAGAAVAMSLY